ncbi:hypothetical protein [Aneurinibacillus sp. REN35]|uniref:hypothetical protein n=1 Tax=Aneurinibacillus sp. REN35 TaxID=3237286 RepID=UPI003527345C
MNQIEYQRSIIKEEMMDGQEEAVRILTAAKAKEAKDREEKWEQKQAKEFSTLTLPLL